jgi:hypothetical protein
MVEYFGTYLGYYSLQYNCDKGEIPDIPLFTIPAISPYEKYGVL